MSNESQTSNFISAGIGVTSGSIFIDCWYDPVLIETKEVGDTLELIYKQQAKFSYTYNSANLPIRVFKIIYSCIDGKWNKSEPIFGEIIPASEESYEFEK